MAETYNRWERFYHRLNLIFNGIVAITLIPFVFSFLETQKEYPEPPVVADEKALVVKTVLIIISAAIIGFSRALSKRSLTKVKVLDGIESRLKTYLNEKIKHYAFLELAALLACAGLYLTKDHLFTFVYVFVLFIFSLGRPTFERVAREINISETRLKEWGESHG